MRPTAKPTPPRRACEKRALAGQIKMTKGSTDSRLHGVCDSNGRPVQMYPSAGQTSRARACRSRPDSGFPMVSFRDSLPLRQIWGSRLGKPHPVELRVRALALVEQGNTHTEAARRLCVSIKFVNDMVRLKRETGALAPKPQGNPGRGKLTGVKDWVQRRIAVRPDLTIDELTAELAADHGLQVHRSSVGRLLLRLGLSHKKRPASA